VGRSAPPQARRDRALAPAIAAACAIGLVAVGVLALAVAPAHGRDAAILRGFTGLYGASIDAEIRVIAQAVDPLPYALLALLCVGVALARRRMQTAVAAAIALVGSGLTAQSLKHLLGQPRYAPWLPGDSMANGWPSGHATAAMTLALCAVVVAPPAWRAAVALFACGCTISIAFATLALTWHYPSDVLAGLLVGGLWVSAALAVLGRLGGAAPVAAPPPLLGVVVLAGACGALVAAALVAVARARVRLGAVDAASAVAGALVIAGLTLALVVIVAVAAPEAEP
jgi:membrane-associated phospholipid phosphatase